MKKLFISQTMKARLFDRVFLISFWKIGDTTWRKMIKNKIVLHKRI